MELRRTALHALHRAQGARLVPFAGWEMPVQYRSILDEVRAVRTAAGLFDVSHMGEVRVTGPGAAAFLDHLLPNTVGSVAPGRAVYAPMCDEAGGVIDDLIVYRLDDTDFLVCVNASNREVDVAWMSERAAAWEGPGVTVVDASEAWSLLALQGPAAPAVLAVVAPGAGDGLRRFGLRRARVGGVEAVVARTGYTGEDGYEVFVPWEEGPPVAEALLAAGAGAGLQWCGLGARDTLRTEAGYPLYGHELGRDLTPLESGLAWAVKLDKPGGFIGRDAIAARKAEGLRRRIAWFRTGDRRILRPGAVVRGADGAVAGEVRSGTLSPGLGVAIGSVLVTTASLEAGSLTAEVRGDMVALEIVRPPLVPLPKL